VHGKTIKQARIRRNRFPLRAGVGIPSSPPLSAPSPRPCLNHRQADTLHKTWHSPLRQLNKFAFVPLRSSDPKNRPCFMAYFAKTGCISKIASVFTPYFRRIGRNGANKPFFIDYFRYPARHDAAAVIRSFHHTSSGVEGLLWRSASVRLCFRMVTLASLIPGIRKQEAIGGATLPRSGQSVKRCFPVARPSAAGACSVAFPSRDLVPPERVALHQKKTGAPMDDRSFRLPAFTAAGIALSCGTRSALRRFCA